MYIKERIEANRNAYREILKQQIEEYKRAVDDDDDDDEYLDNMEDLLKCIDEGF